MMSKYVSVNRFVLVLVLVMVTGPAIVFDKMVPSALAQETKENALSQDFRKAADRFDVPYEVLAAIAYAETHFDDHSGEPSSDNGYSVMHLVNNPSSQSLLLAAKILQVSPELLKTNRALNIMGGAAVLRAYADEEGLTEFNRKQLADWYPAIARYSNATDDDAARFYADEVYNLLDSGFEGESPLGESVIIVARKIEPNRGRYTVVSPVVEILSADYGPALFSAANSGNYAVSNRETTYPIQYVVIHTTQGSYAGTISWFKNPVSNVSAHYVIRSRDGQITQMVRNKDIGYHAGNLSYNRRSIGIEHEGFVSNPSWYTDAMYRASAALTRSICLRYGIPMTRSRIIGHVEVPGATHTDPGRHWNWTRYMQLVTQSTPSTSIIIDNQTSGRVSASGNWGTSSYSSQRYGSNYFFATPQEISDPAWFKANIPSAGTYEISVWYAANSGYNSSSPFVIVTTGGNKSVRINQKINGGKWVSLGTFNLAAGDHNVVGVSRWTTTTGYIIADAVRITRQ